MPCYFPLQATFSLRADGKKDIKFSNANACLFYSAGVKPVGDSNLSIPCGRCMGCRLEKSRQWAVRCVHEASLHDDNCFITLTYAPEFLPSDGSLVKKHMQDFLKRLRQKFDDRKIRVFYCGEYGEKFSRPHYHAILFNLDFPDKEYSFKIGDFDYFTSSILDSLWGFGKCQVTGFSFDTAAYVARYCTKKVSGSIAEEHYAGRLPEFAQMSLKPAIGREWFEKFGDSDVIPFDEVVMRGAKCKPPRYYDILLERKDPVAFEALKERRKERGLEKEDDNSFVRLCTKQKCLESRMKCIVRKLERNYD